MDILFKKNHNLSYILYFYKPNLKYLLIELNIYLSRTYGAI